MTFRTQQKIDYWVGGLLLSLLFVPVRLLGLLLRRDHSMQRRKGCVVIKMVGAGSLFLAMPSMQAIRQTFPKGRFFLVGTRAVTSFAQDHDWFDACWTIDNRNLWRLLVSSISVLVKIALNTDNLIDLEVHSRLTTSLGVLSMVRNRIGFVDQIVLWRRGFYTHMTYFSTHGPVYAFYDLLAKWYGIDQIDVTAFHRDFRDKVSSCGLPAGLVLPRRYIALGHACSEFGRERQLQPSEWKRLLKSSLLAGSSLVFLGGPSDVAFADQIIEEIGTGLNLCGKLSIAQSAEVIAGASRFFGIDSMLLHLARALAVNTVSVWGPTDPATRLRPRVQEDIVSFAQMPCSPCLHVTSYPPCQGRRDCMAAAVDSLVNPRTGNGRIERTNVAVGWDVSPNEPRTRAISVLYA